MSVPCSLKGKGASVGPKTISPPIPAVRLITTSVSDARIRSTTSRYRCTARSGAPVSGSRTWQCTTAAPALAASIAAVAICSGLRGTLSLRSCVLPEPVNAAVMKTLSRMASGMVCPLMCRDGYEFWLTAFDAPPGPDSPPARSTGSRRGQYTPPAGGADPSLKTLCDRASRAGYQST